MGKKQTARASKARSTKPLQSINGVQGLAGEDENPGGVFGRGATPPAEDEGSNNNDGNVNSSADDEGKNSLQDAQQRLNNGVHAVEHCRENGENASGSGPSTGAAPGQAASSRAEIANGVEGDVNATSREEQVGGLSATPEGGGILRNAKTLISQTIQPKAKTPPSRNFLPPGAVQISPRAVPVVKLSYEEHRGSSSPPNMPSYGGSIVSPRDFGTKPRSAIRASTEDAGSEVVSVHAHDALIEKSDEEKEEEDEEDEGKPFAVKSKGPTFFGLVGLIETNFPKKAVASTPRSTRGSMDASMDRSDFIDYATLPSMSPRQPLNTPQFRGGREYAAHAQADARQQQARSMPLSSFQQQQANRHVEGEHRHVHQHVMMHPHGQAASNGHPAGARYYAQSAGMNGAVVNPTSTRRPEVYDGTHNRWGMHDPRNVELRGGGMHTHRGMYSARDMECYGDMHTHRSMDLHGGGMHTHRGMHSARGMEFYGDMHTHRSMDLHGGGMHTHRGMHSAREMELNGGMHTHRGMYTPREVGVMHLSRDVRPLVHAREQQHGATAASGSGIRPKFMQANGDQRNEARIASGVEGGDICEKDAQNEGGAPDTVSEPNDNQGSDSKGRGRKRGPLAGQSPGEVDGKSPMNYPLDNSVTSTACDAQPVGQQGEMDDSSMVSKSSQSRPFSVPKLALSDVVASLGAGSLDVSQAPHTPKDVYNADKSPGEVFRGGPFKSPHAPVQSAVAWSSQAPEQQQQASLSPRMQQPESHRSSRGSYHSPRIQSAQHPTAYISPRLQPVAHVSPGGVYVSPRIQPVVYHHPPRAAYNSPREGAVPEIFPRMRSSSPPALVQHTSGHISSRPDTVDLRMLSGWAVPDDENGYLRPKTMSSAIHPRDTGSLTSQFDQGRRVPRSTSSVIHLHTPMSQAGGGGWREGGGERFLLGDRIEVLNDDRGSYPASPMDFTRSFSMIQSPRQMSHQRPVATRQLFDLHSLPRSGNAFDVALSARKAAGPPTTTTSPLQGASVSYDRATDRVSVSMPLNEYLGVFDKSRGGALRGDGIFDEIPLETPRGSSRGEHTALA